MTKKANEKSSRMSDEAVKAKTGKTLTEWFAVLHKDGAKKLTHQEIVKLLGTKHDVGSWWQQMVTVAYEQHSGLRSKHERPDGFQISVSRTVSVPLAKLYKAFASEKSRTQWLAEDNLVVRTAIPNKSLRVTWIDGKTSLEIAFLPKNENKSQVVVQHSKLRSAAAAAKMKIYWGKALDQLRATLEKK
jgi:uncharacterized protein YndB with AHSA1/START domain